MRRQPGEGPMISNDLLVPVIENGLFGTLLISSGIAIILYRQPLAKINVRWNIWIHELFRMPIRIVDRSVWCTAFGLLIQGATMIFMGSYCLVSGVKLLFGL